MFRQAYQTANTWDYRIYSNKCHGAYLILRVSGAALIRGRRLFGGGAYLRAALIAKGHTTKTKHFDCTIWCTSCVFFMAYRLEKLKNET